jgi:hypothetical protein
MRLAAFTCLLLLAAASAVYAEEKDVTELKIETTREWRSKRSQQFKHSSSAAQWLCWLPHDHPCKGHDRLIAQSQH